MIQKVFKVIFLMSALSLANTSCVKVLPNGGLYVPIPNVEPKFPVQIFYGENKPTANYDFIEHIVLNEEKPLEKNQIIKQGRMLKRGNNEETKQLLLAQLTMKATEIGAHALINVTYKVFATATSTGYELKGDAVRFGRQ